MTTQVAEQTEAQRKMAKVRAARKPKAEPDARLDRILSVLEAQGGQIEQLGERIRMVEGGRPQFVPMRREPKAPPPTPYRPPEELVKQAKAGLRKDGDSSSRRTNYLENPEFAKRLPPEYRPVFRSGDMVRINPEAQVFGSDKVWGDILRARQTEGVGEVLSIQYITKTYEPKYTVVVPGLTQKDGDGFRESELLPYA